MNTSCDNTLFCRNYNVRLTIPEGDDYGDYIRGFNFYQNPKIISLSLAKQERMPTIIDYLEYICITWFTFEFGIKCMAAPNLIKFFQSFLNWIDFAAILWFYIDLIFSLIYSYDPHPLWDLLGTVRIMRLFKFFNHYPGLKIIIASLKASSGILRLLVFFIGVAVILFASLIYHAEKLTAGTDGKNGMSSAVGVGHSYGNHQGNENQFNSIIEAMW